MYTAVMPLIVVFPLLLLVLTTIWLFRTHWARSVHVDRDNRPTYSL